MKSTTKSPESPSLTVKASKAVERDFFLRFQRTTIGLSFSEHTSRLHRELFRFFQPLCLSESESLPEIELSVRDLSEFSSEVIAGQPFERVDIRKSSAARFNIWAEVYRTGGYSTYVNESSVVRIPNDDDVDRIELFVSGDSEIQVVELIRTLFIRLEENLGSVVVHASAVTAAEQLILFAGAKGAGKTTLYLEALGRTPDFHAFSGDKVFCRSGPHGRISCASWRDWPHIGSDSLARHRQLRRLDPSGSGPVGPKILLDPLEFEWAMNCPYQQQTRRLTHVVIPSWNSGQDRSVERIEDLREKQSLFQSVIERSNDATYADWNTYRVPDFRAHAKTLSELLGSLSDIVFIRASGAYDFADVIALL